MRLTFRFFAFFIFIGLVSVVTWFSWDNSITTSKVPWARLNSISLNNIIDRGPRLSINKTVDKKKWIVVTSIQYPTEDVKNLALQSGWTVVVVADTKTPTDWSHPGVHYLSVEDQASFGSFAQLLPFNSYTRKNLGYLYAMMNGAEWIYDTDDDNKPYGLGLAQFDYGDTISGLRYTVNVTNRNMSEQLFNPYQFFGFKKMWPRGFPLEYLRGHNNGKNRMIACRKMTAAVVQQGIVSHDPDMDAIFRLLNADKESGLHVSFNKFVPPITLEEGTYSPWNSQNTLFHRRAFFTLYLPTSVAFRVTDIWRSYFAQKLLHLIGEQVAFYPVNAVQFRNAHDYLKDFSQERDVYEKSGKIVEFLDQWTCPNKTAADCTEALALAFQEQDFWREEDYTLVKAWIQALKDMNYKFPELKANSKHEEYKVNSSVRSWNCREANIDASLGEYDPDKTEDTSVAQRAVDYYTQILDWCGYEDGMNDTFLPLAEDFAQTLKQGTLEVRQNQVLVLINNFPWSRAIGLLQRMYQPFFAMTIFCGTWQSERFQNESLGPLDSVNYINMNRNEMQSGRYYHYCVSKVRDLRLQNVRGYWFVADDSIFNLWAPTPVDIPIQPLPLAYGSKMYWHGKYGQKFLDLLQTQFKDDKAIQTSWKEFQENLEARNSSMNATDLMLSFTGKVCWDFFYLPTTSMEYFGNLIEVLVLSDMHVENAVTKIIHSVEFDNTRGFQSIWTWDRGTTLRPYNASRLGLHPVKLSYMDQKINRRLPFCSIVIKKFVKEIFGQEISLNMTTTEGPVKNNKRKTEFGEKIPIGKILQVRASVPDHLPEYLKEDEENDAKILFQKCADEKEVQKEDFFHFHDFSRALNSISITNPDGQMDLTKLTLTSFNKTGVPLWLSFNLKSSEDGEMVYEVSYPETIVEEISRMKTKTDERLLEYWSYMSQTLQWYSNDLLVPYKNLREKLAEVYDFEVSYFESMSQQGNCSRIGIEKLQRILPHIDWSRVLDVYLDQKSYILCLGMSESELRRLSVLIGSQPKKTVLLYTLMQYVTGLEHAQTGVNWRMYQKFASENLDKRVPREREMGCLALTFETFPGQVAKAYYGQHVTEETMDEYKRLLHSLKREYEYLFEESDWISDEAKDVLMEKLDSMKLSVMYLEAEDLTDELRRFSLPGKHSFWDIMANLRVYNHRLKSSAVASDVWRLFTPEAYYNPEKNFIVFNEQLQFSHPLVYSDYLKKVQCWKDQLLDHRNLTHTITNSLTIRIVHNGYKRHLLESGQADLYKNCANEINFFYEYISKMTNCGEDTTSFLQKTEANYSKDSRSVSSCPLSPNFKRRSSVPPEAE